jgi:hypothetical protein
MSLLFVRFLECPVGLVTVWPFGTKSPAFQTEIIEWLSSRQILHTIGCLENYNCDPRMKHRSLKNTQIDLQRSYHVDASHLCMLHVQHM